MSLAELKVFAEDHDLLPPGDQSGAYLVEEKSYGRWRCIVEVQGDVVKSSEYRFLDSSATDANSLNIGAVFVEENHDFKSVKPAQKDMRIDTVASDGSAQPVRKGMTSS